MGRSPRPWLVLTVLMLGAHAGLALDGSWRNFVVVDEVGHLPSGLAHWWTGDFRAYRVNPPLPRMLAALPMLVARPSLPGPAAGDARDPRPEWLMGLAFAEANRERYLSLARLARLPGIVWSVWGAWLIGRWARDLYGPGAGCLATALWCFDPTVIAFAQVVTPDVPAAVAGLTAMYVFGRYLQDPSWRLAVLVGLSLGVAELTKFTLLLFYMVIAWPLASWLGRRLMGGGPSPETRVFGRLVAHLALMVGLSLMVIQAGYGLPGLSPPLGRLDLVSRGLSRSVEALGPWPVIGTVVTHVPLPVPRDFIQGIDLQYRDFEAGFPSYLLGEWRHRGWWYYYLVALAVKLPIGTLALIAWGLARAGLRMGACPAPARVALIFPPILIIALVSAQTGFNHHMRYVLPAFPFLFVVAGAAWGGPSRPGKVSRVVAVVLALGTCVSAVATHPHQLSYFNMLAGGPENGDRFLVDSNIDWGQDLLVLKEWLDEHPQERPIGLAYYQIIDPRLIGIAFTLPPRGPTGLFEDDEAYQRTLGPRPGLYAISVNHLRGSTFPAPDGRGGFHWSGRGDFEYFQRFQPIARAGHSIRIYAIGPVEAATARREMGLPALEPGDAPGGPD